MAARCCEERGKSQEALGYFKEAETCLDGLGVWPPVLFGLPRANYCDALMYGLEEEAWAMFLARLKVIDGWLVYHEPPIRIVTRLAEDGINWKRGEVIQTYLPPDAYLGQMVAHLLIEPDKTIPASVLLRRDRSMPLETP